MWEISTDELVFGEKLGAGAYGSVYKGKWRQTVVAVKQLHEENEKSLTMFYKEVMLMCKLRHPNIVQYLGVCNDPQKRCLVMEYVPGKLASLIRQGPMDVALIVMIAKGIAAGMVYLHSCSIIHRDLKPSNILLDEQWNPKIVDFGVSRESEGSATMTGLGTPLYMAPEILKTKHYGSKVDVYSFGLILWMMVTGKKIIEGLGFEKGSHTPVQIAFRIVMGNLRPPIPDDTPVAMRKLITDCWDENPDARPSFTQVTELLNTDKPWR